jgi:hypothetical protein
MIIYDLNITLIVTTDFLALNYVGNNMKKALIGSGTFMTYSM